MPSSDGSPGHLGLWLPVLTGSCSPGCSWGELSLRAIFSEHQAWSLPIRHLVVRSKKRGFRELSVTLN